MANLSTLKYLMYIGGKQGFVYCMTSDGELVWHEDVHETYVVSILVGSGVVVSASYDKTLAVTDQATGKVRFRLKGHTSCLNRVAMADGVIVSVSDDHTARVWSLNTGECLKTLTDHTHWVFGVAILGDRLATCSWDNTIKVYSMTTFTLRATLVNGSDVHTVAFLPDGRLVTGDDANTVTIWDIKAKRKVHEMKGHPNFVWTVTVLDNGLVASGDGDGDGGIKLWDPETGTCLRDLNGHTAEIKSICDNGNGTITSASLDSTIRTWDIATGGLINNIDTSNKIYNFMNPRSYDGFRSSCVAVDGRIVRAMHVSASVRAQYRNHLALSSPSGQLGRFPNELIACVVRECSPVELMHLLGACVRTRAHVVDNVWVQMLQCRGDKAKMMRVTSRHNICWDVLGWWQAPGRPKRKNDVLVSAAKRAK